MRNDKPLTIKLSMPQKRAKPAAPIPGSVKWRCRGRAGLKLVLLFKESWCCPSLPAVLCSAASADLADRCCH